MLAWESNIDHGHGMNPCGVALTSAPWLVRLTVIIRLADIIFVSHSDDIQLVLHLCKAEKIRSGTNVVEAGSIAIHSHIVAVAGSIHGVVDLGFRAVVVYIIIVSAIAVSESKRRPRASTITYVFPG